jgi:hypothetical protein
MFSGRGWDITFDTSIMFHERADIPAFFAVISPQGSLVRFEMDNDVGS